MKNLLKRLGINKTNDGACIGGENWIKNNDGLYWEIVNPSNHELIAKVQPAGLHEYNTIIDRATKSVINWKKTPAPERGNLIRLMANALRANKDDLGSLVSLENGKIKAEGDGEVQEMIDIADFAVGLSRQLYGLTMHSERPQHRMYEQWHPLGVVGIVSAFNFPVAVWAWNAFIAAVCGNISVWKPSPKTPLTAIAVQNICNKVLKENNCLPVFNLVIGENSIVGESLIRDSRINLISFTGSTKVGRYVSGIVAERFGKSLLELGGNNALIVDESANLKLAVPAIVFGAVGTAGQRCTSTRRVLAHQKIFDDLKKMLKKSYKQVKIGDPLNETTLMGPLIDQAAVRSYQKTIKKAKEQGGIILCGGKVLKTSGNFVEPTIIEIDANAEVLQQETFAPILYLIKINSIEEGISINNDVPQGLSSALFTDSLQKAELFLSNQGSDCGIANINIGTSGAEIGGAFGGEKETGGGRESGSDAWRAYMRRQTNTINWSSALPLAQGIKFEL